jgi:RNA polymerase sigma factor (sigma-70 family)
MPTDQELLHAYVRQCSEKAFVQIVQRNVNMVYGAALRQLCGNATLAEEVTQSVFTTLAEKAPALTHVKNLSAWMYATTRFTVSHAVRTERRRQAVQQKAYEMEKILAQTETHEAPEIPAKLIDAVLQRLAADDREAILRRFFVGQSFAAIGAATGASEDAARMRVGRALEKVRDLFARKGITPSATAVGLALANQAVAAPASLAAAAASTALARMAVTTAKIGFFTLMTTSKGIAWIATSAAVLALSYSAYEYTALRSQRDENRWLSQETESLKNALQLSESRAAEERRHSELVEQQVANLRRTAENLSANRSPAPDARPPAAAPTKHLSDAERMLQMKPLLESGMPISGAVVVMAQGKPVQKHVDFVMGKETRIEGVDDGIYAITPTLNPDGSVKYSIVLSKKDDATGVEKVISIPSVIQTPWNQFTMQIDNGATFAFDPDNSGP